MFGDFLTSQAQVLERDGAYPQWNAEVPKAAAGLQGEMHCAQVPISQFFPE